MKFSTLFVLVSLTFIFLITACGNEDDEILPPLPSDLKEILEAGGTPDDPGAPEIDTIFEEIVEEDRDNKRFLCASKTLSVRGGGEDFPLFDTNADVIYPGNLLQWKSLSNGTPDPIVVKRAGGTISYNLNTGDKPFFQVEEVKKSSIQNAMNNIIANAGNVVPANFQLTIEEVQSLDQLAVSLGVNMETFLTQVGTNLSFSSDRFYNRFLVKLTQQYYTMSFDLPTDVMEVFHPSVTNEQLAKYVQPGNPPTFISSVTYGRIFYMLVESTASSEEISAELKITYDSFYNNVEGEVNTESFKSLENVKIKAIAYGGDAKGTFDILGQTSIDNIANRLAESTDIRAGLPLSYVVRSVNLPSQVVRTNLATEYDVINCELKGSLPPIGYESILDLFEDGIGAMTHVAGPNNLIFNKAGTKYAWYTVEKGKILGVFDLSDQHGPLGGLTLEAIGAAARFPHEEKIYLFSMDGLSYQELTYEIANYYEPVLPSGPIGTFNENEIYDTHIKFSGDLSGRGVAAISPTLGTRFFHVFTNSSGSDYGYAEYNSLNGTVNQFCDENKGDGCCCTLYTGTNNNKEAFGDLGKIGAATTLYFGEDTQKWLYINDAGDMMVERTLSPEPTWEGPWIIN